MLGFVSAVASYNQQGPLRETEPNAMVPGAGLEPARGFPQGIFVPLQLSLLHARSTCICGLDFTFAIPHALAPRRIRQGPSSLYTFSGEAASGGRLTSA